MGFAECTFIILERAGNRESEEIPEDEVTAMIGDVNLFIDGTRAEIEIMIAGTTYSRYIFSHVHYLLRPGRNCSKAKIGYIFYKKYAHSLSPHTPRQCSPFS